VERREGAGILFRDAEIAGERVRVAYTVVRPPGWDQAVAVQVAETMQGRERLAAEITRTAVGVLIALLGILVALVLHGLKRGLEPLNQLRALVLARSPDDLSPLPEEQAPDEVAPLVATLNAQVERVGRGLEAQRRFIADAAHQMKTPLAGLKMQAELAQRAIGEADLRERLAQIEAGADRAHHLVQRLLALARADEAAAAGRVGTPVDLDAVARGACEALAPQALARRIDFGFEPCGRAPCVIGDATMLGELVSNLAENAIKYTPAGGQVTVRVTCEPALTLEVEDTGPGIPPAERERVFERFRRAPGAAATGAGLGLPIVRAIAERHGASVVVDAGPGGNGCCFRVSGWRLGPSSG
jgi:two-component system sensor histidine kinase TctE